MYFVNFARENEKIRRSVRRIYKGLQVVLIFGVFFSGAQGFEEFREVVFDFRKAVADADPFRPEGFVGAYKHDLGERDGALQRILRDAEGFIVFELLRVRFGFRGLDRSPVFLGELRVAGELLLGLFPSDRDQRAADVAAFIPFSLFENELRIIVLRFVLLLAELEIELITERFKLADVLPAENRDILREPALGFKNFFFCDFFAFDFHLMTHPSINLYGFPCK